MAWMSIPIWSMSASRCSTEVDWTCVRSVCSRLTARVRALAKISRGWRTACWPATISAAFSLSTWQWMSTVNHLPRAWAGPGKRPGIGVPAGRQVNSISGVSRSIEQGQIDALAHLQIAAIARVQVVAAIVDRQHAGRMLGVAQGPVEIDDGVEGAALADPAVELLARLLALRRPGAGQEGLVLERRQGRREDPEAAAVGALRHLFEAGDHLRGGHLFVGLFPAVAQIVGAEHDDRMGDAGLRQHVAVEAPEAAVAADVVQDAVAAEPHIHDPKPPAAALVEAAGEPVGPAAMRVKRRDIGVGQRVAERDHPARLRPRQYVDAAEEE